MKKYYWTSYAYSADGLMGFGNVTFQSEDTFFDARVAGAVIKSQLNLQNIAILYWVEISEDHYNAHLAREVSIMEEQYKNKKESL